VELRGDWAERHGSGATRAPAFLAASSSWAFFVASFSRAFLAASSSCAFFAASSSLGFLAASSSSAFFAASSSWAFWPRPPALPRVCVFRVCF
jgi:hypothetical protein